MVLLGKEVASKILLVGFFLPNRFCCFDVKTLSWQLKKRTSKPQKMKQQAETDSFCNSFRAL